MKITTWEDFTASSGPRRGGAASFRLALSIGVFDGVHLGHQKLLRRVIESPYVPGVLTFRQNPRSVLGKAGWKGDLCGLDLRLSLLEKIGIAEVILIDFSPAFGALSGKEFVRLLSASGSVALAAVGTNFHCGFGQDTGAEEFKKLAGAAGIETLLVTPFMMGGKRVSSSRIRDFIAAGDFAAAASMLGRPYAAKPGTGEGRLLPPPGNYPARVKRGGEWLETEALVTENGIVLADSLDGIADYIEFGRFEESAASVL